MKDCERRIVRDIKRQIKSERLKEIACGEVESHFRPYSSISAESKKMDEGPTDRPTDGQMDQWTDIPSFRDAWTHPKTLIFDKSICYLYLSLGKREIANNKCS